MNIRYLKTSTYLQAIRSLPARSVDSIVIAGSHLLRTRGDAVFQETLEQCIRILAKTGVLALQGTSHDLPERVEPLMRSLQFKYWIVVESAAVKNETGLPQTHAAVLLFAKSKRTFKVNRVRLPHRFCGFCNRTLKDWGGKSHLMNPAGYVLSDVWRDLPKLDNHAKLSLPALELLLRLLESAEDRCLVFPLEGIAFNEGNPPTQPSALPRFSQLPPLSSATQTNRIDESLLDVVHCGDALDVLRKYPDNSVDLAFADPPYNLDKAYACYDDAKDEEKYIAWCDSWLEEYIRLLKPTGSLYVLSLPKWAVHHASFLNRRLCFQNWIGWDAISEPRGKIMPAHYALLFYTKHPTDFTFNYGEVTSIDAPSFCLRASCVRERKAQGLDPKVPLTDIWWDIHRIKHKKDRDSHPCQLPDRLMERIIRLSSNRGDVVLDALCGVGTTPIATYKLRRRFVAVDIDPDYVDIVQKKIAQLRTLGTLPRAHERRAPRKVTKKELQLELRELALSLGRLPTEDDVREKSQYDLQLFHETFLTWGQALKAAKLEMNR
jgi:DNA modification methylase